MFEGKGLSRVGDFVRIAEALRRGKTTFSRELQPGVLAGMGTLWRLLHAGQLVLGPGALQVVLALLHFTVKALHTIRNAGLRVQRDARGVNGALVRTSRRKAGGHQSRGMGHSGAGIDKQVTAYGAGVGDLALAHRGGTQAGTRLAQLVDLVHNAAQVSRSTLVQTGCHGKRDGGGRYSYIWGSVCVRQLAWSIVTRRRLLSGVTHKRRSSRPAWWRSSGGGREWSCGWCCGHGLL